MYVKLHVGICVDMGVGIHDRVCVCVPVCLFGRHMHMCESSSSLQLGGSPSDFEVGGGLCTLGKWIHIDLGVI